MTSFRGVAMARKEPQVGVVCERCRGPIVVQEPGRLAEEFSVRCERCGHRGFYAIKDIRPLDTER
ncbi:MAG TPA: hypothetical protein VN655_00695 [Pseudolabrys sp.]|jgi:hypothetical protein|nr:hypothetical protein [Pseudolabrys sp.]